MYVPLRMSHSGTAKTHARNLETTTSASTVQYSTVRKRILSSAGWPGRDIGEYRKSGRIAMCRYVPNLMQVCIYVLHTHTYIYRYISRYNIKREKQNPPLL